MKTRPPFSTTRTGNWRRQGRLTIRLERDTTETDRSCGSGSVRRRDSWCGGTPVDLSEVLLDPTPESVDGELELDNWNIGLRFLSP